MWVAVAVYLVRYVLECECLSDVPHKYFKTLARLGGRTLGIDATPSNIAIASLHAGADPAFSAGTSSPKRGTLTYEHTSVEELLAQRGPKSFDVVCSMEVIEHVDNPRTFLSNCATLVKASPPTYV